MPFIKGEHHTEDTRKKMSLSHQGKRHTEETKRKISETHLGEKNPFYGKHHTEETKQKISLSETGKKISDDHKKKISKAMMEHVVTKETRQKIRERALEQFKNGMPEETRAKISKAMKGNIPWSKGKHLTEETRAKISESVSLANTDWDFYNEHGCIRSQYPYGPEWTTKLRKQIAARDNYTCVSCREVLPEHFAIHHIDYDKWNNSEYNLVFLCNYCHNKTNGNRAFWEQYFKDLQIARGFGECQDNSDQTAIDNWTST